MKTQRTILFAAAGLVLVGAVYLTAYRKPESGIPWTDFGTGSATAHSAKKKMLVDVYTDWCTWCKVMEKNTYSDAQVASYVREHFVPVKLNAESQEMRQVHSMQMSDAQLAGMYGVQGYPTTIFVDENGTPIFSRDGYIQAGEFKTVLRFVGDDAYKSMTYEQYRSQQH